MSIEIDVNGKENTRKQRKESAKIARKTFQRIFRYSSVRIITILLTVGLSLYLTLMVLNLGGYVDEIVSAEIDNAVGLMGYGDGFDDIPEDELEEYIEQLRWQMQEAAGLHESFAVRTARWWFNGITLQWGSAERSSSLNGDSYLVKDVIFSRLPYTLLLVGVANVILFFASLGIAMVLSTQRGKFWDRLMASLTPISSAPSWVHGVILLAIFALELGILPFKGIFDGATPEDPLQYAWQLFKHMVIPVSAIVLSVFFQGVYTWRTFFIVHSGEDYVELAKAKGLPDRVIRRKHLLRPTLPSVITSFTMMLIGFWEEAIALETFFDWPGLGALFLDAVNSFDRPVVVAIVVLFAYLLGLSVILLDVIYAVIDPRVRLGSNGTSTRMRSVKKRRFFKSLKNLFKRKPAVTLKKPTRNFFESDPEDEEVYVVKTRSTGFMHGLFRNVRGQILKYPMAAVGLVIIVFLVILSVYTVIAIPYDEAVSYWHSSGWLLAPKLAQPTWVNFFRRSKLPESVYFDSTEETEGVISTKEVTEVSDEITDIELTFTFEFTADEFPQDLAVYFDTSYEEKVPYVSLIMITPDGRELELDSFSATYGLGYYLSYENLYMKINDEMSPVVVVFGDPETDYTTPLKGTYEFQILAMTFEEDSDINIQATVFGKVYGLFGTDSQKRDLTIAILWGTPVALTYGIIGAVVTTITTILIAAVSAWFGGILDEILQRITELNIMLPALPIAIMVYILYSKSVWVILGVMIAMNIFGSSLKEYRAMFMQFKEAPYIEAAMAYGCSDWRIIFKYLLPRIVQVMVPQLVISVPSFVFLEATLAYLGVAAPYLPTWGKVINQALNQGTFWGYYYWVLEPIIMVLITGLAFAFVGFALDKILNPRLREL